MSVDPAKFETKDMRIERLERELAESTKERNALRVIASDHLAGSNLTVKPEDAADFAKWAANPGAVRHLLRRARYTESGGVCCDCGVDVNDAHRRTQLMDSPGKPWRDCIIAAAWRALGDSRGQADIERAREEALREHARRTGAAPCTHAQVYHRIRGREAGGAVEDVCRACGVVVDRTPCSACGGSGIYRPDNAEISPASCLACGGRGTQRPRT